MIADDQRGRFIPPATLPALPATMVCATCKRAVIPVIVTCEAHRFTVWHCPKHGGVAAMRSAVVNGPIRAIAALEAR